MPRPQLKSQPEEQTTPVFFVVGGFGQRFLGAGLALSLGPELQFSGLRAELNMLRSSDFGPFRDFRSSILGPGGMALAAPFLEVGLDGLGFRV